MGGSQPEAFIYREMLPLIPRKWAWLTDGHAAGWLQRQELVRGPSPSEHHPDAAHTALTRLGMEHPDGYVTRTGVGGTGP